MPWVRLDDGFPQHPKLLVAGPLARDLLVSALCHCNRFLTDGWIGMEELRALGRFDGLFTEGLRTLPGVPEPVLVEDVIEKLIAAGVMEYHDGRLLVHDYTDYQPTKAEILARREVDKERKRASRAGSVPHLKRGMSARTPGRGPLIQLLREEDVHARESEAAS